MRKYRGKNTKKIKKIAGIFFAVFRIFSAKDIPWVPGGVLSILSDGDVPFFRVSFSPLFSSAWYRSKAIFLEPVVKRRYFWTYYEKNKDRICSRNWRSCRNTGHEIIVF